MNILTYTISILIILSILSYSSIQNYIFTNISQKALAQHLHEEIIERTNKNAKNYYNNFRYGNSSSESTSGIASNKTKNALLNLYPMIYESESEEGLLTKDILKDLISIIFHENAHINDLFSNIDIIINEIVCQSENRKFTDAYQLSEIKMGNEELQELLYGMLMWKTNAKNNLAELSNFSGQKKIWIYHSPSTLVQAIFGGSTDATSQFITFRYNLYKEINSRINNGEKWNDFQDSICLALEKEVTSIMHNLGRSKYSILIEKNNLKYSIEPPS